MWKPVWGGCQVVVVVLCLSELVTVGLLVFSHGFLLTRQVIVSNSSCPDLKEGSGGRQEVNTSESIGDGCSIPPTFKRAVILLIDALRYDFTTYNHSLKDEDALPYQNKMPVFDGLLRSHPQQSLLVPFLADAPTTTMQRLKGLTTGSLPTFIDASHNFASEEITEDNIIDQLVRAGKPITALGDDTWAGLFPGRFARSHFFPSFDVMDLHTVDQGILSHLAGELARQDWEVMVAHFLGVDHCGHRYGPTHPEMSAKLTQMNDVVKTVVEVTGEDTLLVVMGDHGMTQTGDHGGDSSHEVTATLFLYSPALSLPPRRPMSAPQPVAQVDLVPSLALALGLPIPYSNLGKVVEDVLVTAGMTQDDADTKQLQALSLNVKQVQRYLNAYKNLGNTYPEDLWQKLESMNETMADGKLSPRELRKVYAEYLTLSRMMCQEIWAKFDVAELLSGLFLMVAGLVLLCLFTFCNSLVQMERLPVVKRVCMLTLLVNCLFLLSPYVGLHVVGCVAGCLVLLWVGVHRRVCAAAKLDFLDYLSIALSLILCLGSFSNSYVVIENYVIAFILSSVVSVQVLVPVLRQQCKSSTGSVGRFFKFSLSSGSLVHVGALFVVLVCVRCSFWYWKCREEQYWCTPSQVHIPLTGLPSDAHNLRYASSLVSLTFLIYLPRHWLLTCGNLNGTRLGVLLTRYVPVVCGLLVAAYWALQAVATTHNMGIKEQGIPPRLVFQATFLYLAGMFALPLLIYEVHFKSTTTIPANNPALLIPQLYKRLKEKYSDQSTSNPANMPVVYGLATGVSAPLVAVLTMVVVAVVVVAGDGLTEALQLLLFSAAASLLIQALTAWKTKHRGFSSRPGWCGVCVWFLLSLHGFFTTGHQATFPTLHWSAAFIVGGGGWGSNTLAPALLVGFNTYSSHVLFGLALPFVLLAPISIGVMYPKLHSGRMESEEMRRGEFTLVEEPEKTRAALLSLSLKYILLHTAKVFFSAVAAFILRRHLMVWKIFAPHFIFEAVGLLVTLVSVVLGLGFTLRVLGALTSWSECLQKRS